ncbi:MAG: hypothetical protein ACE5JX_14665 [Acidobacteriota bacterium]
MSRCDECGAEVKLGDWPFCRALDDPQRGVSHGRTMKTIPFKAYYDPQLGQKVESLAHRWRLQREKGIVEGGDSVGADLSPKSLSDAANLTSRGVFSMPEEGEEGRFKQEILDTCRQTWGEYNA